MRFHRFVSLIKMYTAIATDVSDKPMVKAGNERLKYSSDFIPPNTPPRMISIILITMGRKFGDPPVLS